MKKLILLCFTAALVFTSCGNDDDSPTQDPLIGTWTYHKSFENSVEDSLDDCLKRNSITVKSDATLTEVYYDFFDGNCELDYEDSAIWENLGNSIYKITYDVDEIYEDKITFEGNTFFVENTSSFGGETFTYKEVYIRN